MKKEEKCNRDKNDEINIEKIESEMSAIKSFEG